MWGKSHWSFRNYDSNGEIYNFCKPESNKGDFRLSFWLYEKRVIGGATTHKYQNKYKNHDILTIDAPPGPLGVSKEARLSTKFEFGSCLH